MLFDEESSSFAFVDRISRNKNAVDFGDGIVNRMGCDAMVKGITQCIN